MIGRRVFVAGCPLAGPIAAQEVRRWRIAFLYPQAESGTHRIETELAALGIVDGRTAAFERRWAEGQSDRFPRLAEELVGTHPDVIVASTTASALALRRATTTIPIVVLSSGDAVGTGLAQSLARPGGNITGNSFLGPELAAEIAALRILQIFFRREYVDAGCLLSYGASWPAMMRKAAGYVHRILHGANPAELPILQPTSFELVLNLAAARRLAIAIPDLLLTRADEVIE